MARNQRTLHRSFAGGEISQEMFGRIDDAHFQSGAARLRNFITTPQGQAKRRPGFQYIAKTKVFATGDASRSTRIIPFTYDVDDTAVIEIGHEYIRIHVDGATLLNTGASAWVTATVYAVGNLVTNGGNTYYCTTAHTSPGAFNTASGWYLQPSTAYEIETDYQVADIFNIKYAQSNDVLTLTHPGYQKLTLLRHATARWELLYTAVGSTVNVPTGVTATATNRGVYMTLATHAARIGGGSVEGSPVTFSIANPGGAITGTNYYHGLAENDVVFISDAEGTNPWSLPDGFYRIAKADGTKVQLKTLTGGAEVNVAASSGYNPNSGKIQLSGASSEYSNSYVVTTVGDDDTESVASSVATQDTNNLFVSGAYNTISWTAPAAGGTPVRYNIYKKKTGLFGYIGQVAATETSFKDDNIAPDMGKTPPLHDDTLNTEYPGCVAYFEQRKWFARTTVEPQSVWATKTGSENDLCYSLPIKDNDRIYFKIASLQNSTIKHLVPMAQMVLLSTSAEYRLSPINSDAITPTSVSVRPQSYVGASDVKPLVVNNKIVFCADRGGHVRQLNFDGAADSFVTGDLSLRATHLFDGLRIVDSAYQKAPQSILWFVSTSGLLLGCTYVPEEDLAAWHSHDTDGTFESCCVVAEGTTEDRLYVVVQRSINGSTVRYIERLGAMDVGALADCFYVDAGVTWTGASATVLTPAPAAHLIGETVSVLGDGTVRTTEVVGALGAITLDSAATKAQIGLPYNSDIQTLPLVMQVGGYAQGENLNIGKVWIRVFESSGFEVGPDEDELVEADPYTTADTLRSENIELTVTPKWQDGARLWIRQSDPVPLTVTAIVMQVTSGGG